MRPIGSNADTHNLQAFRKKDAHKCEDKINNRVAQKQTRGRPAFPICAWCREKRAEEESGKPTSRKRRGGGVN